MLVLAIHTAGPACDIALCDTTKVLAETHQPMLRGQDASLPGLVADVLRRGNKHLDQVDRFAVVTGPGSFTGIRVGVAFARGLALPKGTPCVGVTTLEASLPSGQQGSALVALPAQKRPPDVTFWTQTFRTGEATGPAMERCVEDLVEYLDQRPHNLFGDETALAPHFTGIRIHPAAPTARRAAQVALRLDPALRSASPTYARAPDAALPSKPPR
ncbi:MAG: tRNA (adenosine(37)-N6)-threonylcarbamoyltransferase complex dimerization subunit type 1 TsaB [Pseudomonadota bacterium]